MGFHMIHSKFSAADPVDAEIKSALEDAGPDIAAWREVTARLAGLNRESDKAAADMLYADELMSRIESRAARIEIEEGGLTGAGLIAYAISAERNPGATPKPVEQALAQQYADEYQQAVANRTAALRAFTVAEQNLAAARKTEANALENYRAHGASRLVR